MVRFEVYAESVYGSDVLTFDTIDEAIAEAKEWQKRTDNRVIVERVETEIVFYAK